MSMYRAMVDGVSTEEQINHLAERLSAIHGTVAIRHEANGVHLTMACPLCLQDDGLKELKSRHLQINAEKYLKIGKFKDSWKPTTRDNTSIKKGYAQCMKTHGPMSMNQIESWDPLEKRPGLGNVGKAMVLRGSEDRYLVMDDKGQMVPDRPGKTTSLLSLPHDHPAMLYLEQRDYDPVLLVKQFQASWCFEEAPEGDKYHRWYSKHGWEWKSTPQGRIVFYSSLGGSNHCWQARYLSVQHEGQELLWHPYHECWESRPPWEPKEGPRKYLTASGALRNTQLCGFDHVVSMRKPLGDDLYTCVLTEGPMDAARFPDRGLAILGKSMSDEQAMLVSCYFKRAVLAFDADAGGRQACASAQKRLSAKGIPTISFFTDEDQKRDSKLDVGMLGYARCAERLEEIMKQF